MLIDSKDEKWVGSGGPVPLGALPTNSSLLPIFTSPLQVGQLVSDWVRPAQMKKTNHNSIAQISYHTFCI